MYSLRKGKENDDDDESWMMIIDSLLLIDVNYVYLLMYLVIIY